MSADSDGGIAVEDLVATARRRWLAILVAALLGATAAFAVTSLSPPRYESVGKLLIGGVEGSTDSIRAATSIGSTYAGMLTAEEVLRDAAALADLPAELDVEDLRAAVDVTSNDRTRLLTISTTWENPEAARRMTTALVWRALSFREQIPEPTAPAVADERILEERRQDALAGQVTVVSSPTDAADPVEVPRWLFVVLAGLLSAAVAFAVLVFLHLRRAHRRAVAAAVAQRYDLLGTVSADGAATAGRAEPVMLREPSGRQALEYAALASRVLLRASGDSQNSVAVVGVRPAASSRSVAVNLALALASAGRQVRLVDLSDPAETARMLRQGGEAAQAAGVSVELPHGGHLAMVTPGSTDPITDRAAVAQSDELPYAHLVVVHADHLLTAPDTLTVLRQVDAVLLVAERDSDSIERDLSDASSALALHGAQLLGTVLVDADGVTVPAPSRRVDDVAASDRSEGVDQASEEPQQRHEV